MLQVAKIVNTALGLEHPIRRPRKWYKVRAIWQVYLHGYPRGTPVGGCRLANLIAAQSIAAVQVRHWNFPGLQRLGLASCTQSPWQQSCGEKAASILARLVGWSGTLKPLPRQQHGGRPPRLRLRLLANGCARLGLNSDLLLFNIIWKFWRSPGSNEKVDAIQTRHKKAGSPEDKDSERSGLV